MICWSGAVELRDALSAKYGADMPPTLTFDHPTITAIAAHLAMTLEPAEQESDQVGVRLHFMAGLAADAVLRSHMSVYKQQHLSGKSQLNSLNFLNSR